MNMRLLLCSLSILFACSILAGREDYVQPNYDESKIAPYALEDPLTFADGRKVGGPSEWAKRREEILGIFAREMYGAEPPKQEALVIEKFDDAVTLAGFGIRRQYRMWFRADKSGPAIDWLVLLPRHEKGPVPTILFLNYGGNHELIRDPEVRMPEGAWLRFAKDHKADPSMRGRYENMNNIEFVFPAHMILARGYALVSACYAQVSPDTDPHLNEKQPPTYSGVFELWPPRDETRDDNTTALGAWAWALSRGLDLVERIPECDARRAIATGYSRLGKTALLAAARDERFAICVPNQAGGGGCTLAKRDFGENIGNQMINFPHWYCRAYAKYRTDPAKLLTFDQHLLLATLAPRGLLVQGYNPPWFDTKGEYLSCKAASPVWTFLGHPGLPDVDFPDNYDTSCIGGRLGYVRRTENHGHAAHDWMWLMDFADGFFGKACRIGDRLDLQDRIDKAAERGGGRVSVPAGRWKTGCLRLRSNVELHLDDGAELVFPDSPSACLPAVETTWEGTECRNCSPLVYAFGVTNAAITGKGTLSVPMDGWRRWACPSGEDAVRLEALRAQLMRWNREGTPLSERRATEVPSACLRPQFVQLNRASNVRLEDFRIRGTPFWTIHVYRSDDVTIRGVDVSAFDANGNTIRNSDGVDVECSKRVLIEGCVFDQGDDAIAIKAGRDADGRRINRSTEDVTIRNCRIREGHTLLAIGSEVAGGVRRVKLSDCKCEGSVGNLFFVKTNARRGGFVEDIQVENVTAEDVRDTVFLLAANYWYLPKPGAKGLRRTPIGKIRVSGISCEAADFLVRILGDTEIPAKDVSLERISARRLRGRALEAVNVTGLTLDGKTVSVRTGLRDSIRIGGGQEAD